MLNLQQQQEQQNLLVNPQPESSRTLCCAPKPLTPSVDP